MDQNFQKIPVFLISFNRLTYLQKLVEWLENNGYENIHIVDNASTYPPLLEYFSSCKHTVHRLDRNFGHLVVWTCGKFADLLKTSNYVVSDCDILPDPACPKDALRHFWQVLEEHPKVTKVGFSLRIDDLPDCYLFRSEVSDWESQFWQRQFKPGLFFAPIDTTFALYRPGVFPSDPKWWASLRTAPPYTARHLPWYEDSKNLTEEELFYQRNLEVLSSHWSVTDALAIKEQNKMYRKEIQQLRKELNGLHRDYFIIHRNPIMFLKLCARRVVRSVQGSPVRKVAERPEQKAL